MLNPIAEWLDRRFLVSERGSTLKQETLGGAVTFMTMAYIVVVNPTILQDAGMPFGPAMVATALTAMFGCLLMGVLANRPYAIAPYMGQNAFVAYTVTGTMGYSWETALFTIFISGVLLLLLTLSGGRKALGDAVPMTLKISFSVGIGLFIAFVGAVSSGIIVSGTETPLAIGDLTQTESMLAILCLLTISALTVRGFRGSILVGMLVCTAIGLFVGVVEAPAALISSPPPLSPVFLQWEVSLTFGILSVLMTVFILDVVDTMGTLVALGSETGQIDEEGRLIDIQRPFTADSLTIMFAGIVGTTSSGVFVESASGIKSGARTGISSIIVGLLFGASLLFTPIVTMIPSAVTGPAMMVIGMMMFASTRMLDFHEPTDFFPAVVTVSLMVFTYNIGIGICAGFIVYVVGKVFSGKGEEVTPLMWVLMAMSLLFFIFYPY